jgi:hypothetical protein
MLGLKGNPEVFMNMQQLLAEWQSLSRPRGPSIRCCAELDPHDAARLLALAEMYPGCTQASLMADLLHVALEELQAALPYVHGRQTGVDELGDPVHEDAGPTPRFLALTRKHLKVLQEERSLAG